MDYRATDGMGCAFGSRFFDAHRFSPTLLLVDHHWAGSRTCTAVSGWQTVNARRALPLWSHPCSPVEPCQSPEQPFGHPADRTVGSRCQPLAAMIPTFVVHGGTFAPNAVAVPSKRLTTRSSERRLAFGSVPSSTLDFTSLTSLSLRCVRPSNSLPLGLAEGRRVPICSCYHRRACSEFEPAPVCFHSGHSVAAASRPSLEAHRPLRSPLFERHRPHSPAGDHVFPAGGLRSPDVADRLTTRSRHVVSLVKGRI